MRIIIIMIMIITNNNLLNTTNLTVAHVLNKIVTLFDKNNYFLVLLIAKNDNYFNNTFF